MKKNIVWVIVAVVAVLLLWAVGVYNGLVGMQGEIDNKWAQVENNLQRRYDLIPNLVNTVKGYAQHEEDVFTEIADARAKLAGSNSVEETAETTNQLESGLGRLLAISESYPELKADQNFLNLQDELAGTENRLAVSRKDYNDAVSAYNITIRSVPTNIIAGIMGAQAKSFFEISQAAHENVTVNFD
ncbi:LemA family protein [bacterium]|nr:LemA family protein [bacterium]